MNNIILMNIHQHFEILQLQHMSESRNSPASSLSIGPLDKSKALQEQDLLQDMLSDSHTSSVSPVIQPFQMFKEDKPLSQLSSGMLS